MEIEEDDTSSQTQQKDAQYEQHTTTYNEKSAFFTKNKCISSSESSRLEFKDYKWPFTGDQDLELILLKTICSFLNRQGGTILIGVNDSKVITGIKLNDRSVDEVKRYFDQMKRQIFPMPAGLIETVEVPLRREEGTSNAFEWILHMYVLRVAIRQGQVDRYYTFKQKGTGKFSSAFREDASSVLVSDSEKIMENIYNKVKNPSKVCQDINYIPPDQQGLSCCSRPHTNKPSTSSSMTIITTTTTSSSVSTSSVKEEQPEPPRKNVLIGFRFLHTQAFVEALTSNLHLKGIGEFTFYSISKSFMLLEIPFHFHSQAFEEATTSFLSIPNNQQAQGRGKASFSITNKDFGYLSWTSITAKLKSAIENEIIQDIAKKVKCKANTLSQNQRNNTSIVSFTLFNFITDFIQACQELETSEIEFSITLSKLFISL